MLGVFFHPRSAARQREVAELSVPMAAQASVAQRVLGASVAPREVCATVQFKVRYRFGEYLRFALPMAIRRGARRRRSTGRPARRVSAMERALMAALLWPLFALKSWRVGACRFRIDAQGIERLARNGRLYKPWSEIALLRREAPGWILGGDKGAMPLPVRCMTAHDLQRLEGWIAARRAAIRRPGCV